MTHVTTDFDKYGQIYVDDGSGPAQIDDNMFSLSEVAGLEKGVAVWHLARTLLEGISTLKASSSCRDCFDIFLCASTLAGSQNHWYSVLQLWDV